MAGCRAWLPKEPFHFMPDMILVPGLSLGEFVAENPNYASMAVDVPAKESIMVAGGVRRFEPPLFPCASHCSLNHVCGELPGRRSFVGARTLLQFLNNLPQIRVLLADRLFLFIENKRINERHPFLQKSCDFPSISRFAMRFGFEWVIRLFKAFSDPNWHAAWADACELAFSWPPHRFPRRNPDEAPATPSGTAVRERP